MGKITLAPGWMRSLADICFRKLDTDTHNKAAVVCVAVLGEDGFEFRAADNIQELDPTGAITVLLEGHAMTAAASLATVLEQATVELRAATDIPDDSAEAMQQLQARADAAIRSWLRSVMMYAGQKYQADKEGNSDAVLAAISRMVGMWGGIAAGQVALSTKEINDEIAELRAIRDAVEASDYDVQSCVAGCGKMVISIPDGMAMCAKCADKEEGEDDG